jgi:hypothetical protein
MSSKFVIFILKQSHNIPMEAQGGEEVWLLLTRDLGTRWGEWSASRPGPRFTPGERTPCTHCTRGWVDPRAGLDTEARGKILCLFRGSNLDRPVVQSVVRHCTDSYLRTISEQTYKFVCRFKLNSKNHNIQYMAGVAK